ncbi:ABC transporter ATP-binding protein [Panacagrimonas sp.]|uniref:ABC transporter ATP-binding protein n=1 Tax=Panacagrimonas sp. TaxID=2480088 RepID=UPI003B51797F
MRTTPPIRVRNLVAAFGDNVVLRDVSLDVAAGEILVIMGGSGSGKSTLLRHMLGLLKPVSGDMELLGIDTASATDKQWMALRRRMGVAFQSGALFSSMNVGDNIRLPLRERTGLDPETIDIMMRIKLDVVNLPGCEDLMPAELSGGMIKRAALARALIMDPELLFLDEPSAGLDPVIAASLDELLLQLRDATGMSVVVITHELESAFKIADRICVLDRGEVIALGTVDEVRNSDSERVQALLTRKVESPKFEPQAYLQQLIGASSARRVN